MNERIRELAEQAGIDFFNSIDPEFSGREYCEAWTEQQQKFAELIVRECIGCCDEVDRINQAYIEEYCVDPENGPKECIQVIKAHFGVEE